MSFPSPVSGLMLWFSCVGSSFHSGRIGVHGQRSTCTVCFDQANGEAALIFVENGYGLLYIKR